MNGLGWPVRGVIPTRRRRRRAAGGTVAPVVLGGGGVNARAHGRDADGRVRREQGGVGSSASARRLCGGVRACVEGCVRAEVVREERGVERGVRRAVLRRPKAGGAPPARSCRCRRAPGHAKTGIVTDLAAQGTKTKKEHVPVRQMRRSTRLQKSVFAESTKVLYKSLKKQFWPK